MRGFGRGDGFGGLGSVFMHMMLRLRSIEGGG